MKKIIAVLSIICMITACSAHKNTASTKTPAHSLRTRLASVAAGQSYIVGHHDDPVYGHSWKYMPDSSDVKNVTGDYPGIFDWDLGLIEWGNEKQLDGVPFDLIKKYIVNHHNAGGINTISWHARNPRGGDAWNVSDANATGVVKDCLTPGHPLNDTLKTWLGRTADFIGNLRDNDGKRIPVVFRPWHEHTGNWFWWGAAHCTPQEYQDLWKLTREVFNAKGIDNVVWAYAPGSEPTTEAQYLERYPGDEYVDIMGFDTYCFGGTENFPMYTATLRRSLDLLSSVASKHNKIPVIAETGYEGIPYPKWFTEVFHDAVKDYPFAYVVFWRNAWDKPTHYYTPYPGHPAAADFKTLERLPQTLFLNDLK